LVNNLKTVSSRYLKKEFPERFSRFYWKDALWSGSYFISSCGGAWIIPPLFTPASKMASA
ncbi:MAG: hypothetical protein HC775_20060, partial [Hyellaceae cyanobacterium CSU_1_1]|nr:hypothetical protein [Hyellaceae cyanobacterium CSU_1_1]